jgi:hypothetical protein
MSDRLQRLLDKARKRHARKRAADAILIDCKRPEDVPARVDVLIAAGNVTEAERPRCVFWPNSDPDHWDGTQGEWVLMQHKNMTPEDLERLRDEWVLTRGENTTPEDFQRLWDGVVEDARAAVRAAAASDHPRRQKNENRDCL